jgi:hypothetical protein
MKGPSFSHKFQFNLFKFGLVTASTLERALIFSLQPSQRHKVAFYSSPNLLFITNSPSAKVNKLKILLLLLLILEDFSSPQNPPPPSALFFVCY